MHTYKHAYLYTYIRAYIHIYIHKSEYITVVVPNDFLTWHLVISVCRLISLLRKYGDYDCMVVPL